jgi:hypothetical protein
MRGAESDRQRALPVPPSGSSASAYSPLIFQVFSVIESCGRTGTTMPLSLSRPANPLTGLGDNATGNYLPRDGAGSGCRDTGTSLPFGIMIFNLFLLKYYSY